LASSVAGLSSAPVSNVNRAARTRNTHAVWTALKVIQLDRACTFGDEMAVSFANKKTKAIFQICRVYYFFLYIISIGACEQTWR